MATQKPNAPARTKASQPATISAQSSVARYLDPSLNATLAENTAPEPTNLIPVLRDGLLASSVYQDTILPLYRELFAANPEHAIAHLCGAMMFAGITLESFRRSADPLPTHPAALPGLLTSGILACRCEFASQRAHSDPEDVPDSTVDALAEEMRYNRIFQVERDDFRRAELAGTIAAAELPLRTFAARIFRAGQLTH